MIKLGKVRLAAIAILVVGASIISLFVLGGLVLNVTPSVPVGLWRITDTDRPFLKGDYVIVDAMHFAGFGAYLDYPLLHNAWGRNIPFLKLVAGVGGDTLTCSEEGIIINGILLPNSQIRNHDRRGKPLIAFPLPMHLKEGQLWLTSHSPRGLDSRYLGPVHQRYCKRAIPLIIFD